MTAELPGRPTATTYDVETLVTLAWRGDLRVPHFQRDFRWQRRDVIRLFDSIVRGYPVGSLLLWRRTAPAQRLRLGALEIDAPARDEALWVVDGQQRITSLANALHPDGARDERFGLAYDLEAEQFVPLPPAEEPTVVPLPVLFDLQKVLTWFATNADAIGLLERASAVTKTLRQFAIPASEVAHAKVEVLQDVAGVPHVSMLPYRHLLVALTRLFAHHPEPDQRSLQLLRRWFWRAAVTGPEIFKGSTTGAIRYYCFAVKRDDLVGSIEELRRQAHRPDRPSPDLRRFRSNEAGTKMLLCSWWAQRPRSLHDGQPFERAALAERLIDRVTALDAVRHVVPRQRVPEKYRTWAANRVLLPDDDVDGSAVEGVLLIRPMGLSGEDWQAILRSHLLDEQLVAKLAAGDVVEFLEDRQRLIQQRFDDYLRVRCEWDFEDTPPLDTLQVEDLDGAA